MVLQPKKGDIVLTVDGQCTDPSHAAMSNIPAHKRNKIFRIHHIGEQLTSIETLDGIEAGNLPKCFIKRIL